MPGWKSRAEREKWTELVSAGKIKQEDFDKRERETENLDALPERIGEKKETITPEST